MFILQLLSLSLGKQYREIMNDGASSRKGKLLVVIRGGKTEGIGRVCRLKTRRFMAKPFAPYVNISSLQGEINFILAVSETSFVL